MVSYGKFVKWRLEITLIFCYDSLLNLEGWITGLEIIITGGKDV